MDRTWLLQEEVYYALHRWPAMLLSFFVGVLLGWLASQIWPASYKASNQIYVGLNPYRAYSDSRFLALANPKYANLDNYQYWQMTQLDGVLIQDLVIERTLEELRGKDSYWVNIDPNQLRTRLDTEWRTSGIWSLSANDPNPERAKQLVQTWSSIGLQIVKHAIQSSRDLLALEELKEELSMELIGAHVEQQELTRVFGELSDWEDIISNLPKKDPLESPDRIKLLSTVSMLINLDPTLGTLQSEAPGVEAQASDYLPWITRIRSLVSIQLAEVEENIIQLELELDKLSRNYSSRMENSLGLSPNLEIQDHELMPVRNIRPSTTLIIVGGMIGLFTWVFIQLILITQRKKVVNP